MLVPSILDDLQQTPAIQKSFAPGSLVPVGNGGMAVVFRAFDPTLDRYQAIKVLTDSSTPEAIARFRDEAKLIATLNHPNLVKIYSFEVTEAGRPYFVMDLVKDADTLETAIDKYFNAAVTDSTRVQWRDRDNQLIRYFLETLGAVEYLHERSIVHHDLKPANILISGDKGVFVTDFGLSSSDSGQNSTFDVPKSSATPSGSSSGFRGTPRYSAPEQLPGGGQVTSRTDVYQLGLILRYLTLNHAPFEGSVFGASGELFERIRQAPDPISLYGDPLTVNPALAPELVAIIHKALQKDPLNRYPSAREFKEDLEAFLDGRQVEAHLSALSGVSRLRYRAEIATTRSTRWVRANRLLATGILASGLGLVSGGAFIIDQQGRAADARIAEIDRQAQIKQREVAIARDRDRAERLLNDARQWEANGNIDAAVNLVQPELLDALRIHTNEDQTLRELVETLEKEHQVRATLVKVRDLATKGYAAAFSGTTPGVLGQLDSSALLDARACLLPKGLTQEGIEEFAQMMSSDHYSQDQRKAIAEAIAQISFCLMVAEHNTSPWDPFLPLEVRQQLASECDRIAEACTACRVKIENNPGIMAIPNTIAHTKFLIERTYDEDIKAPTHESGYFPCDATLLTLLSVYVWNTNSRAGLSNPEESQMPLVAARRSCEVNPQSFLDNMLYAWIVLNIPDNNDPMLRYKYLHTALRCLITAHEQGKISKLEQRDLATQVFKLASDTVKASQGVPWLSRSESLAVVLRAKKLILSDRSFLDLPDGRRAYAMLSLVEGVSSDEISEIGRSLRTDPDYKFDGALISVWRDLYRSTPLNREDAEFLLENKLKESAPMLSAAILWELNRPDETMRLLEETCAKDPNWWRDLDQKRLSSFKELEERYRERYSRLADRPGQ